MPDQPNQEEHIMKEFIRIMREWWYKFRHEIYYTTIVTGPTIVYGDGKHDDTANIQAAIDKQAAIARDGAIDPMFKQIVAHYQKKWYRFLLKRPVLESKVKVQAGTYCINSSFDVPYGVRLDGAGVDKTVIKSTKANP